MTKGFWDIRESFTEAKKPRTDSQKTAAADAMLGKDHPYSSTNIARRKWAKTQARVQAYKKRMQQANEQTPPADVGEYDNEGEMAKTQLRGIVADASHMIQMFSDDQNLPEWVQNKITKAADYLNSAHRYMMNKESVEWVCGKCNCDPCTCEGDIHESGPMHTSTPMKKKFGKGARDSKGFAAYKKYMKANGLDEPTVRMAADNPNDAEVKRMMKDPKFAKALDLYKASFKESVNEATYKERDLPPRLIKKAIGIASDPRFKGGNMTGAVKAIEKLSKGLSDHPQVKAVLRRQNESLEEKLKVSDGIRTWIDDFQKSDAPQFDGKNKEERRDMAIAAYLAAKEEEK